MVKFNIFLSYSFLPVTGDDVTMILTERLKTAEIFLKPLLFLPILLDKIWIDICDKSLPMNSPWIFRTFILKVKDLLKTLDIPLNERNMKKTNTNMTPQHPLVSDLWSSKSGCIQIIVFDISYRPVSYNL